MAAWTVTASVAFTGIYRAWTYRGGALEQMAEFDAYTRGLGSLDAVSAANSGIPLLVATDRAGRNRFAFGLADQRETARLGAAAETPLGLGRAEGLAYAFTFTRPAGDEPWRRRELVDGWFLSRQPASWFETVERYTAWAEERNRMEVAAPPAAAYEPVWNTWYPFGQRIDAAVVEENAEICRRLGIGNLLIDAGYQNPLTGGMTNAEEIRLFNDHTGDWTAEPSKFPDFRALVERRHARGQIVTVWVAPFLLGKATRAWQRARGMLMRDADGRERDHLCPRHTGTAGYLAETFGKLARDYALDGFWLDFMDNVHARCHADHAHFTDSPGEGYNRALAAVRDAGRSVRRDFLMETRMKMSNINAKAFCNVLETTDMPFDFDLNRALGVFVRAFARGVAVKLDPAQWHVEESAANVAKSCATVIAGGTPVFGVDWRRLPAPHLRVVEAWLRFYREHRAGLAHGRLHPVGFERLFPQLHIAGEAAEFIYLGSAATEPVAVRAPRVVVWNASDSGRVALKLDAAPGAWQATVRDCYLDVRARQRLDGAWLDLAVPEGGMLVLERA